MNKNTVIFVVVVLAFIAIFPHLCIVGYCEKSVAMVVLSDIVNYRIFPFVFILYLAQKNYPNHAIYFWCSTLTLWPALYQITELYNEHCGYYPDNIISRYPYYVYLAVLPPLCAFAPLAISYISKTTIPLKTKYFSVLLALVYVLFPILMRYVRLAWV